MYTELPPGSLPLEGFDRMPSQTRKPMRSAQPTVTAPVAADVSEGAPYYCEQGKRRQQWLRLEERMGGSKGVLVELAARSGAWRDGDA